MIRTLSISPRDPLIARDGRPFGISQGARMTSLPWPYPSTLAGTLRTIIGKLEGQNFPEETVAELKQVEVSGPLACAQDSLYFAAPRDAVLRGGNQPRVFAARPANLGEGDGCWLPDEAMKPVCLPSGLEGDFKPTALPGFWGGSKMAEWLLSPSGVGFHPPASGECFGAPEVEYRTHVQIDRNTGAARDEMLFQTAGLAFPPGLGLSARLNIGDRLGTILVDALPLLHPFGGERRLVHWKEAQDSPWACPQDIKDTVAGSERIRMILATPAIFTDGWLPGWLRGGNLPSAKASVKLVGAIVDRWKPISGWSLERGRRGQKPGRRLVPAGSVFFFIKTNSEPLDLDTLWLRSVSDRVEDQREGFGLALWGVWSEQV